MSRFSLCLNIPNVTFDKYEPTFQYLKFVFPKLSNAKLREEIFLGSQMRKKLKDENFDSDLSSLYSFEVVTRIFFGNKKQEIMKGFIQIF